MRRRSSAVEKPPALVSKPMEESSKNEDLKVVSPRSLRRRSQVEEKPSAKEAREDRIVPPSLQSAAEEWCLVAESKTSNEGNAAEESLPKSEADVQEKSSLQKSLDEKIPE